MIALRGVLPEPTLHLPEGLDCPNCQNGKLRRLNVQSESEGEWVVQVECLDCLLHAEYVGEESLLVRIPKKMHPSFEDGV